MNCENCGDDLSGEDNPESAQRDCKALSIGRKWMEDSSLESWFPITAEELACLRTQLKSLEVDLERYEKAMHLIAGTVSTPVWIKDQISNALTPPVTPSSTPQNKGNE